MSDEAAVTPDQLGVSTDEVLVVSKNTVVAEVAADRPEMPLPTEPRTFFLGGLFVLAVLAGLYVAADLVLPVVLAIVLKLLLQPLVRLLERVHIPRGLAALLAIAVLLAVLAALVSGLTGPAGAWAGKLPEAIPKLKEQLYVVGQSLTAGQRLLQQLESVVGGPGASLIPQAPPARSANLMGALFSGTTVVAAGLMTTLVVLFYLLVAGETFLRRLVEILPTFANKRQAVEISMRIERDISAYLVTVTVINAVVGALASLVMWASSVGDPLLWGVLAFVLNFVPILGPLVGVILFLMASVLSLGVTWSAALPVALYFLIHVIEGELATPMLLARRFTINPVAVILALVFWYWMWGVPGAVLAVPMLAITKIVCDDVRPLRAFGHFLEG
jgi:predicted PurR-regulated permease PerM